MTREEALNEIKSWAIPSEKGREVLETLIPELAESEDERIRKEIINYILYKADGVSEEQEHSWIAYLEKQKDLNKMIVVSPEVWDNAITDAYENGKKDGEKQKEPHYTKRNALFDKCVENCDPEVMKSVSDEVDEMLKKEQKPEWKPQPESLEALMYAIEGKWDMISPTSYLSRRLEDLYEGLVNTFNVDESLIAELPKVASRAYTAEDIEELRELKRKIEASMEQKPAEWSEEDINDVIERLELAYKETKNEMFLEDIMRLKSLRPSWKPSAQELGALKTAVSVLTEERTFPKAAEQIQKIIDVFDGKELRKDWKPSEEQMGALEDAFRKDGSDEYRKTINSLYQDLKKL